MNKRVVYLIIGVSAVAFIALALLAIFRIPGVSPIAQVPTNPVTVKIPYRSESLDLESAEAGTASIWDHLAEQVISLEPQVTAIPWATARTPEVKVKAFHNGRDVFFRMTWNDSSLDQEHRQQKFSDACAIMFSLVEKPNPQSIMMGFMQPVNIWSWKAVRDAEFWHAQKRDVPAYSDYYYPYQEQEVDPVILQHPVSAVEDLVSRGVASLTPKERQRVSGRGVWKEGTWSVVMTRPLYKVADDDVQFTVGAKVWAAFAVWEGSRGERGSKKSISTWTILDFQPQSELASK